ncbi:MAG: glycosyltransferase family 4 protein [Deltaproteobacteria bacterium]|nr:glycosyltransferase family 4 protein [Deltaproteobacteria bacterium]
MVNPIRSLVVCADPGVPLLGPSGASAHLRAIAGELAGRGDVVLAVARRTDRRGAAEGDLPLPTVYRPPRRWSWLPRKHREQGERWDGRALLARGLRAAPWRPDLIWSRHSLLFDAPAPRGVPLIAELNAPLALERGRYGRIFHPQRAAAVERLALQRADRVVAVSSWLAEWAVREAGVAPDRVRHVPNGVLPAAGDRAGTRAALGLEGLVIGFLGSGRPWHGAGRLPALLDRLPEATGLYVGPDAPTHPRLRAMGQVPETAVPDLVAAMDVGLAPYLPDAPPWFCPLKVLAYLAQGTQVVAAPVGDVPHLLRDGGGVTVEGDALEPWVEAIRSRARAPRLLRVRPWSAVVDEALDGLL